MIAFIGMFLFSGCSAVPTFLMNPPEADPPSPDEKVEQTMETLEGGSIEKAIQKWGAPHGLSDDDAGSRIYIWQLPAHVFQPPQDNRNLSRRGLATALDRATELTLSTDDIYELMFYTDPKGVIYKTRTKKAKASTFSSQNFRNRR